MCGIAGIISLKAIKKDCLTAMSSALKHRGPDGYGYMLYSKNKGVCIGLNQELPNLSQDLHTVGFAHRRLSIIDLTSASLQPMTDTSGKYCVIYNGEIYNYLELRRELEGLGYAFQTASDTEVLLKAYEAWGPKCVERFNGMWAFALLDIQSKCVIFSRDRFGIKPFYYMFLDHSIYFASEIKGLLAVPSYHYEPNEKVVAKYLLTGLVDNSEETFFNGIYQFPAGHWATISLEKEHITIDQKRYWAFPTISYQRTEQEAIEEFRKLFLDALKIHMVSDVPVGTCLSGGLDSSSIVCASELLRRSCQLPTYTHAAFGYCSSDIRYLEKKYMEAVVEATSVKMNYVEFTPEQFLSSLPAIIREQDEPFGSASIATQWFVFRQAKAEGMTVMLDGQGADETLAGYHTYFAIIGVNLLARGKLLSYLTLRSDYEKEIGPFPFSNSLLSLGLLMSLLLNSFPNILGPVIKRVRHLKQTNPIALERMALNGPLIKQYSSEQSISKYPLSLNEELQIQVRSTCLPALLRYEDRNSMAHSIEARVPFLDYRLVEFLFTLPDDWKINGVTTKYILREAMKGILPEVIRNRKDKIGFKATPDLTFLFVRDHFPLLVDNQTELEKKWFNKKGVEKLLNTQDSSTYFEFILWRILNMKFWMRQHWG